MESTRRETADADSDPYVQDLSTYDSSAGRIVNLCMEQVGHVAVIYSHKWTQRSGHRHKTDWHYMYVVSGQMLYMWRKGDGKTIGRITVRAGQAVYTPPRVDHWTSFLFPTVMIAASARPRDSKSHEEDKIPIEPLDKPFTFRPEEPKEKRSYYGNRPAKPPTRGYRRTFADPVMGDEDHDDEDGEVE